MKFRFLFAVLTVALLVPMGAFAQEEEEYERGELAQIITWRIQPDHAMAYEAAIKKIVEAATAAELGPERGWMFFNDLYTYTLVFPVESFGYFDDPEQWMRSFEGTAGEELRKEAFAEFANINSTTLMDNMSEEKADLSYAPATEMNMEDMKFVHVDHVWAKSGKNEEFGEVTKEMFEFFGEIEIAYPTMGHESHFGDGRMTFVTPFDSKANFYGPKGLDYALESHEAGERWGELLTKWAAVIDRMEHADMAFRPDMTYMPATPEQQAAN